MLDELLKMQNKLDTFISNRRKLNLTGKEMLLSTYVAYEVEMQEMKEAMSRGEIVEEAADVLHFMLSIFNQLLITPDESAFDRSYFGETTDMLELIEATRIYKHWSSKPSESDEKLRELANGVLKTFMTHIWLAYRITKIELVTAYKTKNAVNYERQMKGY